MKRLLLFFIFFATIVSAQKKGIDFKSNLSWEEVLTKAKQENKYIFVDCNASWCKPCKYMDQEIFTQEAVGVFFNEKFISIQIQMDSTNNDTETQKRWYKKSAFIRNEYKVFGYPTYLFFSFDGEVLHKTVGSKDAEQLISDARDAINPDKRYYFLLNQYHLGKRDSLFLSKLANEAKMLGETSIANSIAKSFIDSLSKGKLFSKDNILFIQQFIEKSTDDFFLLFYNNSDAINKAMDQSGYAENYIDYIITKELVDPEIVSVANSNSDIPNWKRMYEKIKVKYSKQYAERILIKTKIRYYNHKKEWNNYTKNLVISTEKYGSNMDIYGLNKNAWDIFIYSNNKKELVAALSWSKKVLRSEQYNSYYLDTYANLLYKLGKVHDAIIVEKLALKYVDDKDDENKNYILETIDKMMKGQKTWH